MGADDLWTASPEGLERWSLVTGTPRQEAAFASLGAARLPASKRALMAASETLVAWARQRRLVVLADAGIGWDIEAELELCDDAVELYAGRDEIWAVGERHVTHVARGESGLGLVATFELVLDEGETGDVFARRLAPGACGGALAPEDVRSAAFSGRVLALGADRRITTLDLGEPSRLPTIGSLELDHRLAEVGTDGRFVYAEVLGGAHWRSWRIGPATAFSPTGREPSRNFAHDRQHAGRHAARLTGVALHLASW